MNLSWDWISKSQELQKKNKYFAIATVVANVDSTPSGVGAKMIVLSEKEFYGTIGGGSLEAEIIKKISSLMDVQTTGAHHYNFSLKNDLNMACGGDTSILVEFINNRPSVYIFGSGHVCLALTHVLKDTPFITNVIDEREEWLSKLPPEVTPHKQHFSSFIENTKWSKENSFVVIMTPGHESDRDILELMLPQDLNYLGMIGSQKKWIQLKKDLIDQGSSKKLLDEVRCPIGLPIGGKNPSEIAISIASQLVQHYYKK